MNNNVEIYPVNNSIMSDAIDRIVVKLRAANQRDGSKVFLCTGAGADGGTTTTAINIAIALADAGYRTLFLDCDLRKAQRYKRVEQNETSALADYLKGEVAPYQRIINNTNVRNLDYILSGEKRDNPIRLLSTQLMEDLMNHLKEDYDYVIVDTPPITITNDAEILVPMADKYMFVVCLNDTTKKELVSSRLQLVDYEDKYIGIVANKMELGQYRDEYRDYDYFSRNNLLKKQMRGLGKKKEADKKREKGRKKEDND